MVIDLEKTIKENKKLKEKVKKKKKSELSKSIKKLSKKMPYKKVLKKDPSTAVIKDYKAESVWGDENRFFKGTMEKEKRNMFFN